MTSTLERDVMIQTQPILWAQSMLEEAEKVTLEDARDAILARIGITLYSRFAVTFTMDDVRLANQEWEERREPAKALEWKPSEVT